MQGVEELLDELDKMIQDVAAAILPAVLTSAALDDGLALLIIGGQVLAQGIPVPGVVWAWCDCQHDE